MNIKTLTVLSIGTAAMMVLILIMMKHYKVSLWKSIPVSVLLTITGTLGTYIWFFVEASWFGGRSYYGAVFLVPIAFLFVAEWLRIDYGDLMDFCAPAECAMLVLMKYQCLVDGCCRGRTLGDSGFVFPSQLVETGNAVILMAVLMALSFREKNRGNIYPWYLTLYGVSRFVLNWFREDTTPLLMGLPAGNLWSLLAVLLGVIWLCGYKIAIVKRDKNMAQEDCA